MSTTYLIIPGYGNSNADHWQTYFEKKIPSCTRVQQQSWDKPTCDDWVHAINEAVKKHDAETVVLVSHSLGGIAIAHWAARFNVKVKGAMLVAPPDLENPWQDLSLQSFTPIPMSPLPFPSVLVASTNDNWTSIERSTLFAQKWNSKLIFIGDAGHISTGAGYGNWEEGLRILKSEF